MKKHTPVSADDHQPWDTVGATGTDASYEHPYLRNSLVIWARDAIDAIKSGMQKELSCGYRYTPDMTPGVYKSEAYDGIMREIEANHIALVKEGRAGSDVVVGDSKFVNRRNNEMSFKTMSQVRGYANTRIKMLLALDGAAADFDKEAAMDGLARVARNTSANPRQLECLDDRMPAFVECILAYRCGEESQQPTCPQVRHRRKYTHLEPILRQSSQPSALGVTCP